MNDARSAAEKEAQLPCEVMLVDDLPTSLRLMSDLLDDIGCRVRPANDGKLALSAVAARAPDLILLDIRMPGLDGYEVCRRLKADPKLRQIPVIFVSIQDDVWGRAECFRVGGVDFIAKPIIREEFLTKVRTQLELRRLRDDARANPPPLQ
ncbi:MAG: response regulator [Candidatus Sedimenticola endophacoides]